MDIRKMKLALSAGALALSMALAGCGGGSGPASPTQAELDAQAAEKRRMEQTGDIMTAITAADMAVKAIDTSAPTQAQIDNATTAVNALDSAIEAAADVEDKSEYASRLEGFQGILAGAQSLLAANAGKTQAETERDKLKEDQEKAAAMVSAANAKALYGLLGTVAADSALVARNSVQTVDGTDTQDSRPDKADRMKRGNDESVGKLPGARVLVTTLITGDGGTLANQGLTDLGAGDVKVDGFSRTTGSQSYADGAKVQGTVHGVAGVFTCASGCSIAVSGGEASKIDYTFTGWSFQANDPNGMADSPDYLEFGWWKTAATKDGPPTAVGVFVNASGFEAVDNIATSVKGSAKYTGSAKGKYAIVDDLGTTSASGAVVAEAGAFDATVELTAKFGDTNTLSGMLDAFKTDDGQSRNWEVKLKEATVASGGVTEIANSVVWKIGDKAAAAAGGWDAKFYNDTKAAGEAGVTDASPSHVGGTFEAGYGSVGRMTGAFGAAK